MMRKPWFWLLLTCCSALCLLFSWHFFSLAFPSLDLSVQMSRSAAQQAAQEKMSALQLAAPDARSAVRFYQQNEVQNFIELEAGGTPALKKLLADQAFFIGQWEVRFYREHDAAHTTLYYSPQGRSLGFTRHLPDQQTGAALSATAARQLAEQQARLHWQIDLQPNLLPNLLPNLQSPQGHFFLAEQSFQTLPNGRIDHHFVYERQDYPLGKQGEGRIRLSLRVAGDQLSQVRYSLKIPESFTRRYAAMRATNTTLSGAASLALGILYGIGGCGLGLLLMWQQGWLISRPAILWAGAIALLQCITAFNDIPGSWFHYDNAISRRDFITQQIGMALVSMVGNWGILAISFMAAESLSRKAFGNLPQFWQLWHPQALRSPQVLRQVMGQTVGAYLWVGFDLAFITAFYYLSREYLGWWSPLDSLVDADILATPMPWLPPVANALRAGFWEECLFRAVPLAGAALIGDFLQQRYQGRFGNRRRWLISALILQALIFGAAHANYAQQPAFARPLELFLPSLVWGLVYLRYGLLPGIIFHYLFDLLLMSLPIFVTQAPGLALDRGILIACGLIPLALPLAHHFWQRLRVTPAQRPSLLWRNIPPAWPAALLNQAWQPLAPATKPQPPPNQPQPQSEHITQAVWPWLRRLLPILACLGVLAWHFLPAPGPKPLPFSLTRSHAETLADQTLTQRGLRLANAWQRFSYLQDQLPESAHFVWQQGGNKAWQALNGRYLTPPVWVIRYRRFDGDVVQRAEEWEVQVEAGKDGQGGQAQVRKLIHRLPESQAGASPTEQAARTLAQQALQTRFGKHSNLREISAQETRLPQRKDWHFTFADDAASPFNTGEARIAVYLAGSEVSSIERYVHVNEEWQRQQRTRGALMQTVRMGLSLVLLMMTIGSLIFSLKHGIGSTHLPQRSQWPMMGLGFLLFLLFMLGHLNQWQQYAIQLKTTEALSGQISMTAITLLIGSLLLAALCAGLNQVTQISQSGQNGQTHYLNQTGISKTAFTALWWQGIALAAAVLGLHSVFNYLVPPEQVQTSALSLQNNMLPALAALSAGVLDVLLWGNLLAFSLSLLHNFSAHFSRRQLPTILILLLLGLASAMQQNEVSRFLLKGFGMGLLLASLYLSVGRFKPLVLVVMWFGLILLGQMKLAWDAPYPGAWVYAVLHGGALVWTAQWWLGRRMGRE